MQWQRRFRKKLVDDNYRYYFQLQMLCLILGTASLVMAISNSYTGRKALMVATLAFFVVSFLNFGILQLYKRSNLLSYGIFEISLLGLFTFFLMTGGTAGFSPNWILCLPACGILLLGRRRGIAICTLMLAIIIFLLWTPAGQALILWPCSPEFRKLFPMAYMVFGLVGYFLETIRSATHQELLEAQAVLVTISETDSLTQLHNRYWFKKKVYSEYVGGKTEQDGALLLLDIDNFKAINDTYGHQDGDRVLIALAQALPEELSKQDLLCRWGGEEFLAYVPDCTAEEAERLSHTFCDKIRNLPIPMSQKPDFHATVSVGTILIPKGAKFDANTLFAQVDKQLYQAKNGGRDQVHIAVYGDAAESAAVDAVMGKEA